jgi:hypothetical protein
MGGVISQIESKPNNRRDLAIPDLSEHLSVRGMFTYEPLLPGARRMCWLQLRTPAHLLPYLYMTESRSVMIQDLRDFSFIFLVARRLRAMFSAVRLTLPFEVLHNGTYG